MTYNLYIKTNSRTYNIFNIGKEDLDIVVNAYNIGKSDFFIVGKKYWISKLFEIRIFVFHHPDKFQDFINLAESQGLFQKGYFSGPYLPPEVLKEGGEDVTRDFIKGDYGYKAEEEDIKEPKLNMEIFISHSSSDVKIAKSIIEIVRKAFNIESKKIRCTSVPGYKLPAGASTDEQLKGEIFSSKAFIGLLTKESISSTYVLFELGARWGVNLPLILLICDKAGVSILNGPIKNINALSALDSSDMLQFLNDLGRVLDKEPESPSGYIDDIEQLKKLIVGNEVIKEISSIYSNDYHESDVVIKKQAEIEWQDDYNMRVHYIENQKHAIESLKKGKPSDLTDNEFNRIRERAEREWPLDYEMRLHEEENQIESLRKLKNI